MARYIKKSAKNNELVTPNADRCQAKIDDVKTNILLIDVGDGIDEGSETKYATKQQHALFGCRIDSNISMSSLILDRKSKAHLRCSYKATCREDYDIACTHGRATKTIPKGWLH